MSGWSETPRSGPTHPGTEGFVHLALQHQPFLDSSPSMSESPMHEPVRCAERAGAGSERLLRLCLVQASSTRFRVVRCAQWVALLTVGQAQSTIIASLARR